MLLKHVYMGLKVQKTFKLSMSFSLKLFFFLISVAIPTQVASTPLIYFPLISRLTFAFAVLYNNLTSFFEEETLS